jgi:WD40 repeat protein
MQSKPIRGAHKDTITCIASSKDSKRFATGSLDRTVVIWKYNPTANPKIMAELKYNHLDSVLCVGFNPLTHQIFSGGTADYAVWTPDVANIEK